MDNWSFYQNDSTKLFCNYFIKLLIKILEIMFYKKKWHSFFFVKSASHQIKNVF